MWQYALRRMLLAIPTLLGVTLIVFAIMRLAPGDAAIMLMGGEEGTTGSAEQIEELRHKLGLDRPLPVQYLDWLGDMVTLNFGESIIYNMPVRDLVARKLPLSAQLGLMGIVLGTTLAIPLGIISALKQDTFWDYVIRGLAIAGISIPGFWIGMMLILGLVRTVGWVPELGYIPLWESPSRNLAQLAWPTLVIGMGFTFGVPLRMTRATMLEVLREDYVRTARSKGLTERVVMIRHALRNALIPVVTLIGLFLPITVSGLVVTETVFSLRGVGSLMVESISARDYAIVQAVVTVVGAAVVIANLGVDLVYGFLDPRIRY